MTRILHIIQQLSLGGAARSMIATARKTKELMGSDHSVVSLLPAEHDALSLAAEAGLKVHNGPDRSSLHHLMAESDIVHVSFWNNPETYELLRSDLPPLRLLLWYHIAGDGCPQIITEKLVGFADFNVTSNPHTLHDLPVFHNLPQEKKSERVGMVYDAADFDRVRSVQRQAHSHFNVGYIGTVNFVKMHPHYITMSSAVRIPEARFIVCGHDKENELRKQAEHLGDSDRFVFRGYVSDIRPVIEILDVYGYPLCENTYASSELNLQEVMVSGVPPVVFPYGGVKDLVVNEFTGLVVRTEREYSEAVEHFYHCPNERERMGRNAKEYALQLFGAENSAKKLVPIYQRLMSWPKRPRIWGVPCGESILSQPVSLGDLMKELEVSVGAERLIESIGDFGKDFSISLHSSRLEEILEAEKRIAQGSTPLLMTGVRSYRNFYSRDAHLRLWMGLILYQRGQVGEALAEFNTALENGFPHWRVWWYMALCAKQAGDLAMTRQSLSRVLAASPDFKEAEKLASSLALSPVVDMSAPSLTSKLNRLQLIGFERYQKGEWDVALEKFEEIQGQIPNKQGIHYLRAQCLAKLHRLEEAKEAARAELSIQPGHPDAIRLLHELEGKAQESQLNPQQVQQEALSLCNNGAELIEGGHIVESLSCFGRALQLEPRLQGANYAMALALEQLGRWGEAETAVRRELELQPSHLDSRKLFHSLRSKERRSTGAPSALTDQMKPTPLNLGALDKQREFWNVSSLYKAMFERVYVEEEVAKLPLDAKIARWNASAESSVKEVLRGLPWNPSWRVLEIGCGVGRLIKPLRERFAWVDGVDISEKMVEFSRQYLSDAKPNGQILLNNGCDLQFSADSCYDLVFSMIVFQHIRSVSIVRNYLSEITRVLKPGGYFRLQVFEFDPNSHRGRFDEEGSPDRQYGFAGNGYTPDQLREFFVEQGYRIETMEVNTPWIWATARSPLLQQCLPAKVGSKQMSL